MARVPYVFAAFLLFVGGSLATFVVERQVAPKGIVRGMVDSVCQPSTGQFREPSDAVSYFLLQIQTQDIDEAARVFPIHEEYSRDSFEAHAQSQGYIIPAADPLPTADFHNAFRGLRQLQVAFDDVSLFLLDVDPFSLIEPEGKAPFFPESEPGSVASRFDTRKLHSIRTKGIGSPRLLSGLKDDARDKAMGITLLCRIDVIVERESKEYPLSFDLEKIDDQWRIKSVFTGHRN